MASEILRVPEEHLLEVIEVIRAGLKVTKVDPEVTAHLTKWCDEEEEYMSGRAEEDEECEDDHG